MQARAPSAAAADAFEYTAEQREEIASAFDTSAHVGPDRAEIDHLQGLARLYLLRLAAARGLPDRERLEERAQENERTVRRVLAGIRRARAVGDRVIDEVEANPAALEVEGLLERMMAGMITRRQMEAMIATRFLLTGELRMEPLPAWLADDEGKRHRREFFEGIVLAWMRFHDIQLSEIQISESSTGLGGALLRLIQASAAPVLEISGESVGPRMICNIVREIKKMPGPWLKLHSA